MFEKRILYIGNKLGRRKSRTITTLDTLSRNLEKEGFTVRTASSKKNKALRLFHMMWSVWKHRKWADFVLVDTYSTQNFYYAVAVGNLCRLFKMPYIPILHGGNLPERLEKSRGQSHKLFHGARYNVAPSGYLEHHFKEAGFKNVIRIPNTLLLEAYPFKKREGLTPKLLWVRSFAEIYNPHLALEVVEILRNNGYDVTLTMVGPDKDGSMERCRQYALNKSLPVTFTGKLSREEWVALSQESDIFINTTNFDNTPVSVIEAMALGLAVVSTNVGGVPFLIEAERDGLLVPPQDATAFANAIERLLDNRDLAIKLTHNAREKVTNFDWEKVKGQWMSILTE